MTNLRRLGLERSNFSDNEVQFLSSCKDLQYLNLVDTRVTADGLGKIQLKNLRNLYLFNTQVKKEELGGLQQHFPNAELELGNYEVKALASDTVVKK